MARGSDVAAGTDGEAFRPPLQARSRRTLSRIVDASLALLGERGDPDRVSVQEIVDRAGSSVGSFYARFDGKDDLLRYLRRQLWEDAEDRWVEAVDREVEEDRPLDALVQSVVRVLLASLEARGRQRAALRGAPAAAGDDPAARFFSRMRRDIRRLLLARRREIGHPDPAVAVEVGFQLVLGALRTLRDDEVEGGLGGLDGEARVRELTRAWMAYLGADVPTADDGPEQVDFFDVWG